MDDIEAKHIVAFEAYLIDIARAKHVKMLDAIEEKGVLDDKLESAVQKCIEDAKASFDSGKGARAKVIATKKDVKEIAKRASAKKGAKKTSKAKKKSAKGKKKS